MVQERQEKPRIFELIKVKRAAHRALKEATKKIKAIEKVKRKLTLKKWKEDDNGGQRKRILQCVLQGGPFLKHILYEEDPIL